MADVLAGKRSKLSDQVAQTIRQRIRTGDYQPGDTLPPVRTLSQEFGVSLNVIQRALLALENDNVVVSHPGRSIEICQSDPCRETAIMFGLIIPYSASMYFASQVMLHAEQVFSERHNFLVLRTSDNDPARERQVAQHLINNGVQGLLIWPTSDDPNADFFAELSEQVPIVFVDRRLDGSELPCVVEDYHSCAMNMVEFFLDQMHCQQLLVVMDDLNITSYRDFIAGLQAAAQRRLFPGLHLEHLPISQYIQQWNRSDYSQVQAVSEKVMRRVCALEADGVICMQSDFLDYVLFQSDAGQAMRPANLKMATISNPQTNTRSLMYNRGNVQHWMSGHAQMIRQAADMLQERILSKKRLLGRFEQVMLHRQESGR